jgi:hypothetical protein
MIWRPRRGASCSGRLVRQARGVAFLLTGLDTRSADAERAPMHTSELLNGHSGGKAIHLRQVRRRVSLLTRVLSNHSDDMNCHLLVFPGILLGQLKMAATL